MESSPARPKEMTKTFIPDSETHGREMINCIWKITFSPFTTFLAFGGGWILKTRFVPELLTLHVRIQELAVNALSAFLDLISALVSWSCRTINKKLQFGTFEREPIVYLRHKQ